jgi:N-acyl-D-amino-acid deacylase
MKSVLVVLLSLFCLTTIPQPNPGRAEETPDIVIQGGRLLDGTGGKLYAADIAIKDGRIVDIGYFEKTARRTIDARGYWVTPGFIDVYSIADSSLLGDARSLGALYQGVTTIVLDHQGSAGPSSPPAPSGKILQAPGKEREVLPEGEFIAQLQKAGMVLNAASFASLGQMRARILGNETRAPLPAEMSQLKRLLTQAMEDGACGLSSRLNAAPDSFCRTEELIELAKIAAARGGVYATILRSDGSEPLAGLKECLRIGEAAKVRVQIHQIHVSAGSQIGRYAELIESTRKRGVDVQADLYPYGVAVEGVSESAEETVQKGLRLPWVSIGSGSPALSADNSGLLGTHPRAFGAFSRTLGRYVRMNHVLSQSEYGNPEEMVRRMTLMPARMMGLRDRGKLAPGTMADIAIFHPEEFIDAATAAQPVRTAIGLRWLIINGSLVLDEGRYTGNKPGKLLRVSSPVAGPAAPR